MQLILWAIILPVAVLLSVGVCIFVYFLKTEDADADMETARPEANPLADRFEMDLGEAAARKPAGTPCRMARLPPTAKTSPRPEKESTAAKPPATSSGVAKKPAPQPLGGSRTTFFVKPLQQIPTQPPQLNENLASTTGTNMSSMESEARSLPPPLSPHATDLASRSLMSSGGSDGSELESTTFTWTVQYAACQALCAGERDIEIGGNPPYRARLTTGSGNECFLEVSKEPTFFESPEAIIGPLNVKVSPPSGEVPSDSARIIGPSGHEYGSFTRCGKGFAVSHCGRDGQVLTLDPVKTGEGSFLEVSAPDGMPIGLAKLNPPDVLGVEIDADPEVDSALIISCVLASFVSDPGLLAEHAEKVAVAG